MRTLRRAARSVLVVALRRLWLPPGLAVLVVAVGGQLGRGWLYAALGVVVAGGVGLVGGLWWLGRENS
ncbi:hypothetical protein AB0F15_26255 [Amycolatopsis sp. NPDC026612]|uniref:hypothetical protein n=1 Tax=Amycolatopsis sp. NPDC026612 TaxID=3155466 RepID=UPI0033DE939C